MSQPSTTATSVWAKILVPVLFLPFLVLGWLYYSPNDHIIVVQFPHKERTVSMQPISHPDAKAEAEWQSAQRTAVKAWNESDRGVTITISEESPNTFSWAEMPEGREGFYMPSPLCAINQCTFNIALNVELRDNESFPARIAGVDIISHEIAHMLGDDDL